MSTFCSYEGGGSFEGPKRLEGGERVYSDCALPGQCPVRLLDTRFARLCFKYYCHAADRFDGDELKFARGLPLFQVAGQKTTTFIALEHKEDKEWYLEPNFKEEDQVSGIKLDKIFLKSPPDKDDFQKRFYASLDLKEFGKHEVRHRKELSNCFLNQSRCLHCFRRYSI